MSEDSALEAEGGVGAGVLSLFLGLPVTLLFNSFVQGQDAIGFLLVLTTVGVCVLYGELYLTMTTGVAFGIGVLMTAFLSLSWWLVGLGITAVLVSLTKYAYEGEKAMEFEIEVSTSP